MNWDDFRGAARASFEAVPPEYREGIEALVIEPGAETHPDLPDIYTLGMCDTESYLSDFISSDTTRSRIILYYGSFQALASMDPDFDWEAEIHETVEHEIKHHLEALAGEDGLEEVDYAMDQIFQRAHGEPFDPWFYRQGEPMGRGVYVVEDHVFLEQIWELAEYEAARQLPFRWRGQAFVIERPEDFPDLQFIAVEGAGGAPPWLELVVVRGRGWWDETRRMVARSRPTVEMSTARAHPAGP